MRASEPSLASPALRGGPSAAFWRGRRVLVAGGTGFLGGGLVTHLHRLGAEVVPVSRGTGCDLRDPAQARRVFLEVRPHLAFNLAANQGGVAYQRQCPGAILHDNTLLVLNTLEAARLAGVERYVSPIAACAYPGVSPDGLFREADFDAGPMHPSADNYGISKRLAVLQAKHYRAQYGMHIACVVLSNTYGPGDHFSLDRSHVFAALLRKFADAVRWGQDTVEVWGRGVAERDLLYLDDAVTGLLLTAERAPNIDLLNVGTGRPTRIADVARTLKRVTGFAGEVVYDPSRPEGPLKKTLDISRLRATLGWEPSTALEEGARRTLTWLQLHHERAAVPAPGERQPTPLGSCSGRAGALDAVLPCG